MGSDIPPQNYSIHTLDVQNDAQCLTALDGATSDCAAVEHTSAEAKPGLSNVGPWVGRRLY